MTAARQLSRAEILALPPACTLADLAAAFGISEPTVRVMWRKGQLEGIGIRLTRMGQQVRVITSSLHAYLGINPDERASPEQARREGAGQRKPTGPALRRVPPTGAALPA